jgi:hypothetical protein
MSQQQPPQYSPYSQAQPNYQQPQPLQSGPPPLQWNPAGVYDWLESPAARFGKSYFYIIPGLGSLLLAVSVFLPWFSADIIGTSLTMNGVGGTNLAALGDTSVDHVAPSVGGSPAYESWHGWLLLALAVLTLIMVVLGITLKNKHFAIASLVAGFIAVGLLGYDLARMMQAVDEILRSISGVQAVGQPNVKLSISTGFGLYAGLASALAIFIGSILTFFLFNTSTSTKRGTSL